MTDDQKTRVAQQFINALPHAAALGMTCTRVDETGVAMTMPYDARLVGDPRTGVIHGGAISTLMDTCSGAAVMAHPSGSVGTATLDLRIDYMRAATPGQAILTEATCYHVTRTVAFVRAVAMDDDRDNPVAMATGAFTVQPVGS